LEVHQEAEEQDILLLMKLAEAAGMEELTELAEEAEAVQRVMEQRFQELAGLERMGL
jgi:hypothetical protein